MQPQQLPSAPSLENRNDLAAHPVAKKLLKLMAEKRTNLSLACDVATQKELLHFADLLGPYICVLKTHIDILEDFTPEVTAQLQKLAKKHGFLLFEDRKFADIGESVSLQYAKGIYRIAEWADLTNAHIVPGPGVIEGLRKSGAPLQRGLLLIAEMSSEGTLAKGEYGEKARELGEAHSDFVCGFITQRRLSSVAGMIHFTPGVNLQKGKDALGQRYRTVEEALVEQGNDIIIVGRDILRAADPVSIAALYREKAWNAVH
jgi:uridine monophosphate synthetase